MNFMSHGQTVEDMYTKAHEILGILYSYADEGRYEKTKKPEEPQDQDKPTESAGNSEEQKVIEATNDWGWLAAQTYFASLSSPKKFYFPIDWLQFVLLP